MAEICQKVLNGFEMPVEWALSIVVPIFKGNGDIRNCSCYGAVELLEHGMKVVERELEKKLCGIVSVDEMQFGFMLERGTVDAVFIMRRMQEEYRDKGKSCICVCGPRESLWQSTKEGVGIGIEEERKTRCLGWISDESVLGSKDENQSGY